METSLRRQASLAAEISGRHCPNHLAWRPWARPAGVACARTASLHGWPCRMRHASALSANGGDRRASRLYTSAVEQLPVAETTPAHTPIASAASSFALSPSPDLPRLAAASAHAPSTPVSIPTIALPSSSTAEATPPSSSAGAAAGDRMHSQAAAAVVSDDPAALSGAISEHSPAAASSTADPESSGAGLTSSMESDAESCSLVTDESGDVQLVCDSDPAHPISLAERAALQPLLPTNLLRDIEAKLEADLRTLAVTILFAVGFVSLEFGITDLIDIYWGDSTLTDIICVAVGLVVVFGVRLSGVRLVRLDRWR